MQAQTPILRQRQPSLSKFSDNSHPAHVHYGAVNLQSTNNYINNNSIHNTSANKYQGNSTNNNNINVHGFTNMNTNAVSVVVNNCGGKDARDVRDNSIGGKIRSNSAISRNARDSDVGGLGKSAVSKVQGPKGAYLIGWGKLPFPTHSPSNQHSQDTNPHPICIPSPTPSILKFCPGQSHIIYLTTKYEAYGLGNSKFGQLGYLSQQTSTQLQTLSLEPSMKPIPILEQFIIQDIYCTPFCTFFITNRDQVYGCGLNNRGQLGVVEFQGRAVGGPVKIAALSKKTLLFTEASESKVRLDSSKKMKVSKIQSYALAERKTLNLNNQEKVLTEKSEGLSSQLYINTQFSDQFASPELQPYPTQPQLLSQSQFITSIVGGPYHSLALSNKGRAFYTGNIYKKSSILNNDYTSKFTQLNLKKIGKVNKIKSGITSIGLLNNQNNLYILGAINQQFICDQPYNIGINCIVDFCIQNGKIWVLSGNGDVSVFGNFGSGFVGLRVGVGRERVVGLECGIDFCMMVTDKGEIYGQGNNYANIFGYQPIPINKGQKTSRNNAVQQYDSPIYKLNIGTKVTSLKLSSNFALALSSRPPQLKINLNILKQNHLKHSQNIIQHPQQSQSLLKRISQLQKQNKVLKDLIKDESSTQNKSQRNIINVSNSSARKKDLTGSANIGQASVHLTKKLSNFQNISANGNGSANVNGKFDLNANVSEKIISKARKFDNSMEIAFEELELGKQISQGGYGIIYKAIWRKTTVAVKIFKIDINSQNSIKDFVSECHAMQALRHPNIVMFLGACTKPPNFAIVLQYCEGGTLWSILQKSGELNWEQRRRFALDTARGMNYLHERPTPILHRDLKSLNLLLDDNKRVKLADFGWTKGLQNYMTGKIGTYQWMAPQVVSSHQYTQKADVFSFAIILWEIASREAPYRNIPGAQVAQDVLNKDLRPTMPKKTPEQFAALMKKCWSKNPQNRPSFAEIIQQLQKMQLPA